MIATHRRAYELARGPIPEGLCVLHTCDNPPCVNPEHLFLGTLDDNTADKVKKGRQSSMKGLENGRAKLTESDVRLIRSSHDSGVALSARFGVSARVISSVRLRQSWRHI